MRRLNLFISAGILLAGCKPQDAALCGDSVCEAGQVCVDETCRTVCGSDRDCAANQICTADICEKGQRQNPPRIDSIDGDGSPDSGAGYTAHRTNGQLIIEGDYFEGAAASLQKASETWDLTICERAPNRMVVALPQGLDDGTYTLSVAAQAGACNAELPILRGEKGEKGEQGEQGPRPEVQTGGGLVGTGEPETPLRLDNVRVDHLVSPVAKIAGFMLEAESHGGVGAAEEADSTASESAALRHAFDSTGVSWQLDNGSLPFGLQRWGSTSRTVTARLKIGNDDAETPFAQFRCEAKRNGEWTELDHAGIISQRVPNGAWATVNLTCPFLPDDENQRVVLEKTGDNNVLFVDYITARPTSGSRTSLTKNCSFTRMESTYTPVSGWEDIKFTSTGREVVAHVWMSLDSNSSETAGSTGFRGMQCRLTVNGQVVARAQAGSKGIDNWPVVAFTEQLSLPPGEHTLDVACREEDYEQSESGDVVCWNDDGNLVLYER